MSRRRTFATAVAVLAGVLFAHPAAAAQPLEISRWESQADLSHCDGTYVSCSATFGGDRRAASLDAGAMLDPGTEADSDAAAVGFGGFYSSVRLGPGYESVRAVVTFAVDNAHATVTVPDAAFADALVGAHLSLNDCEGCEAGHYATVAASNDPTCSVDEVDVIVELRRPDGAPLPAGHLKLWSLVAARVGGGALALATEDGDHSGTVDPCTSVETGADICDGVLTSCAVSPQVCDAIGSCDDSTNVPAVWPGDASVVAHVVSVSIEPVPA
jgi:hypothetical protein